MPLTRNQSRNRSSITSEEIYLLSDENDNINEFELTENNQIINNSNSRISFISPTHSATTINSNMSVQSDLSHMSECFVCFENEVDGNLPIKLEDIDCL